MKKLLLMAIMLLFFVGCAPREQNKKEDVALVQKYVKAVENLDYKTMDSLLADNYKGYGPAYGDSIGKKQAVANWKYNVKNLYKSIRDRKSVV